MANKRSKYGGLRPFDLFSSGEVSPVRAIGRISGDEGEEKCRNNRAERLVDPETDEILGYQLCSRSKLSPELLAAIKRANTKFVAPVVMMAGGTPSSAAFSRSEVEAIVGMRGRSKTEHLREDQRAARILQKWRGEDLVESSRKKLVVYRDVH